MQNEKLLGILGGMGPWATAYFFMRVVESTAAERDQDHINMIILNHATLPDRTAAILSGNTEKFVADIIKDAQQLESMGAHHVAIPCNTTHYFYDRIQASVSVPIINMVQETIKHIIKTIPGAKKVGILATSGTLHNKTYENECKKHRIVAVAPSEKGQRAVTNIIYEEIKKGAPGNIDALNGVIAELRAQECDAIILACTELSYFTKHCQLPAHCVDALEVLVRRSIEHSGKKCKKTVSCLKSYEFLD